VGATVSKDAVIDELSTVLDPCSCKTEEPVNIVDLGLVENVAVDDGAVSIRLVLTSNVCMYFVEMSEEIIERVGDIEGVEDVEVDQETEKVWTPSRMADERRQSREERFHKRMNREGITPYTERKDA